jgi:hypothetical protein
MWGVGERKRAYRVLVGKPEGNDHLEGLGLVWRIILRWLLKRSFGRLWTGVSGARYGGGEGSFERGNELSGSIKFDHFFD